MKSVVYVNPNAPVNPYDVPGEDFTTPIANYPTAVVLSNGVPSVGDAQRLEAAQVTDPVLEGLHNPMVTELDESTND